MKRLAALFLAVLMVFSLLPAPALADGETAEELPAAETTPITEEPQTETGEDPAESAGETSGEAEEKAVDAPAEETPEETSEMTPEETSGETPEETPEITPEEPPTDAGNGAETQSGGSDAIADENSSDTAETENVEAALRAAIESGTEREFNVNGDLTLTADLTVPEFSLWVNQGAFIVPDGVTLTIDNGGFLAAGPNTVIQSGGKLIVNETGNINVPAEKCITVEDGGTVENKGFIYVNGSFFNHGTYTQSNTGSFRFDVMESDLETGLSGVSPESIRATGHVTSEADIRRIVALASVHSDMAFEMSMQTAVELTADLTLPGNVAFLVANGGALTVPAGKTLTVNGEVHVFHGGGLNIKAGAEAVINNRLNADYADYENPSVSVEGTLTVGALGAVVVSDSGWNCTGTLNVLDGGSFARNASAATADEVKNALDSGADAVSVTADVRLDSAVTIPENVWLTVVENVTLTVAALTNNGTCIVYGTLAVEGAFDGMMVVVMPGGTVTPDTVPHRSGSYAGGTEEQELRAAIERRESVVTVESDLALSENLTIPQGIDLQVADGSILTVPAGVTLTVNGSMTVGGGLNVENGARVEINGAFTCQKDSYVSMDGTFAAGADSYIVADAGAWNCTGNAYCEENAEFVMNVATAEQLRLVSAGNVICVTENITLDESYSITGGMRFDINTGATLTVPSGVTLTNNGIVHVYGTLQVDGEYDGSNGLTYVMPAGRIEPESIPHRAYGVSVSEITVSGFDTVSDGYYYYTAAVSPGNAYDPDVTWSIASGSGFAGISEDGVLTPVATGEITVRATAKDGSGVYGEMTVTVKMSDNQSEEERQLRAAIANGKDSYTIEAGSELVTADSLTIPSGFTLIVRGKLIAEDGMGFAVDEGGSVVIMPEGTLENRGTIDVYGGGCIRNEGTFLQSEVTGTIVDASVDYTLGPGESGHRLEDDLIGIDGKYVRFTGHAGTDEELRALLAQTADVGWWEIYIRDSITLSGGDLTIPENGAIHIGYVTLTVPAGTTLTNKGDIYVYGRGDQIGLVVEPGATVVNYGYVISDAASSIVMNGMWQNCDGAETYAYDGTWSVGGEIQNNGGKFASYRDAATAEALIEALGSGVDVVNITADITLESSITVPKNVELSISCCKLTVPEDCTLTNHGVISLRGDYGFNGRLDLKGELEILGSYTGDGTILVMEYGILTPNTIPHRAYGVSVSEITVSGSDIVTAGSTASYTAAILPANAFDPDVTWSIASGSELAGISEDGVLTANAPGRVTVRATAKDGSGVYGETTVIISTAEAEALYAAVEDGEQSFTVEGDVTLYKELTIPSGFALTVEGTLVAPEEPGARPAAQASGGAAVQSGSIIMRSRGVAVQSGGIAVQAGDSAAARSGSGITVKSGGSITVAPGGRLENNCRIDMESGSIIAVQADGTLENNSQINVAGGGRISNDGSFKQTGVPGPYEGNAYVRYTLNEDLADSGLTQDLINVDRRYVWYEGTATSEDSLRDQLSQLENVPVWEIDLQENVTLAKDTTIPEGGSVSVSTDKTLTVPKDVTLTNNGGLSVKGNLVVAPNATLENNGSIEAQSDASVTVEENGTLVNNLGAETIVPADGLKGTGTVQDNGGSVTQFKEVTTAEELKTALGTYTDVRMKADITLDESVAVPENATLRITSGTLTVPENCTLTNSGTVWVDGGRLSVSGTFAGDAVKVNADNEQSAVMQDDVPRLTYGAVAKRITVTGKDTVTVGEKESYTAKTYPEVLEHSGVIWTVVSGNEFASISESGELTANAPGTVVIRAAAKNAAGNPSASVYGDMTVTVEAAKRLPGDVNGDGKVTVADSMLIRRYLLGGWNVTLDESVADVNKDGKITVADSMLIRRYLLGGWNVELK